MSEGLIIPVSVDNTKAKEGIAEVSEAFETLGKEAKKAGTSGAQATNAMAAGAQQAAASTNTLASRYAALKGWIEGTQKSQGLLGRAGQATAGSLNAFFSSLTSEVGELTRGSDGATQSLVNLGAQALPSLGPVGAALAALAGGVGLITRMEREQAEELRTLNSLYDVQARLGSSYANIESSIAATATAAQRLSQAVAGAQGLFREQAGLLTRGFSTGQVQAFTAAVDGAVPAIRTLNGGVQSQIQSAEVMAAVTARNSGQFRQWGLSVKFGTDEVENQMVAMRALNELRIRHAQAEIASARQRLAGARAENAVTERQTAVLFGRGELEDRQRATREGVTRATVALIRAEADLRVAQGASLRIASSIADHEREIAEARENRGKRERAASASNTASLMDQRSATIALWEAQYQLARSQEMLLARDPSARFALEERHRERQTFHLRQQIALATGEYNIRRQASENAAQFDQRRAAALQRVADLTLELSQSEREATERLNAAKERSLEIGRQLLDASRAQAALTTTSLQEGYNRALETENALSAGIYQTREQQLQQLQRDTAMRRTLITLLGQQAEAASQIEDAGQREAALAGIRGQQRALESQQNQAQARERELTMTQLQRMDNGIRAFADTSVNASGSAAAGFDALTGAMTSSASAFFQGEKTFKEASQAMVNATLTSLSEIASKEMVMELARGTASLFVNPPAAGAHFAAAGLYGLVAAGAGAASAATKPSEAGAGGGGSEARRPTSSDDTASAAAMGQVTVTNYYAPVIEGRAATQDQVGMRLNRYQRAGAMRLERHS